MNEDIRTPSSPDSDQDEAQYTIYYDPSMAAGSWANHANIMYSAHEFTIDFVRMNFDASPNEGVLVHRVNVSPWLAIHLVEQLKESIEKFSRDFLNPESGNEHDLKTEGD